MRDARCLMRNVKNNKNFEELLGSDGKLTFLDEFTTHTGEHTHTDQYLNFDGHHHLGHKKSVVKTIFCCFNTVISKEEDRTQEIEHLKSILHDRNYKAWL